MALAVLTKAILLLFIRFALIWMGAFAPGDLAIHFRRVAWAGLGVALVLGPWVIRTWRIVGAPILYSNGGFSLCTSNHRLTFDYFPKLSSDAAAGSEWDDLKPEEQREFDAIQDRQGIRQTHWLWDRGVAFIRSRPWLTLRRAVYKIWIGFSPVFSPAKDWVFQTVYFVSYFPTLVLSVVGTWRSRRQWRELGYVYMLLVAFAVANAIFWAHTSHRMYVEPSLMILAAEGLVAGLTPLTTSTCESAVESAALCKGT